LPSARQTAYNERTEISFASELEARLKRIASQTGKGPDEVVRELVANYLDHDEWFRQEVGKGLASPRSRQVRLTRGRAPPDGADPRLVMKIRWSPEAAADFAGIVEYIHKQNSSADRVAHTMYDSATSLESFPNRGRPGRIDDTRELVLAPLPYIVVYRVKRNAVKIARVLHGSQRCYKRSLVHGRAREHLCPASVRYRVPVVSCYNR